METTQDKLLGGRMVLCQPKHGYRVAVDPVLLAASIPARAGDRVLDLGVGTGAASFCLLAREPSTHILGIDNNPEYLELAKQSIALNGFDGKMELRLGHIPLPSGVCKPQSFDVVMANPPYYAQADYSASPDAGKTAAHAHAGKLSDWVSTAFAALKPGGAFFVIFPGEGMAALQSALQTHFNRLDVYKILAKEKGPARRIIIRATKNPDAPHKVNEAGSLVLHEKNGAYTVAAHAVLWDAASIIWEI